MYVYVHYSAVWSKKNALHGINFVRMYYSKIMPPCDWEMLQDVTSDGNKTKMLRPRPRPKL